MHANALLRARIAFAFASCLVGFLALVGCADAQSTTQTATATALIDEARGLIGQGRTDDARTALTKAITADPNNFFAWRNRGHTYLNARDPDRALSDYDKALTIRPKSPGLIVNVGDAYGMKGDRTRAIVEYTKALGLAPTNPNALNNRGVAYRETGQYDLALADFTGLIQYQPKDAIAYVNRAATLQRQSKFSEAMLDYERALLIDPQNKFAINGKSSVQQAITLESAISKFQPSTPPVSMGKQPTPAPGTGPSPSITGDETLRARDFTAEILRDHMLPRIRALPNVKSVQTTNDPSQLTVTRTNNLKFEVGLGNLLLRLKTAPLAERRSMIDNQLRVIVDMLDKPSTLTRDQFVAALRPVLKNASFLKEIVQRFSVPGSGVKKLPIFRPLAADIVIMLGIDSERTIQFVIEEEGKKYGLSDNDMIEVAKKNLRERATAVKIIEAGPVKLIDFDTSYNASLVLIDEVWEAVAKGAGDDLVVAIPARDAIAFGRANDPQSIAALHRLATIPTQAYGISSILLQRKGKGWVPFKAPSL
jgi:Tfp pilus assembly protein PilF